MLSLSRIIVAYDFSRYSERALSYGADLAARTGAEVHLLYAEVLHGEPLGPPPALDHTTARLEQELRRVRPGEEAGGLPLPRVRAVVVRDLAAAPAILSYAAASEADLIVMGTHGRKGLRHLVLGSTAEEVVRRAPCPVLTAREGTAPPAGISRMLVPIDFSAPAAAALTYAGGLAGVYGAALALLFVAEDRRVPVFSDTGLPNFALLRMDPEIVGHTEEALQQLYAETVAADVPATFHVRVGHPAEEIAAFVRDPGADLVVMGTHALTGFDHFLLGSVTEKVIRSGGCPILSVRSHDRNEGAQPEAADDAFLTT